MKHDVTTMKQLENFAHELIKKHLEEKGSARLLTFSGDLGAGKTTLTQKLGFLLGVPEEEINSPTYVIEQRYPITNHSTFKELVHIDAYRLEQSGDPEKIGLDQTLKDPTKLVVIEWPEKISGFLSNYEKIELLFALEEESRTITIKK